MQAEALTLAVAATLAVVGAAIGAPLRAARISGRTSDQRGVTVLLSWPLTVYGNRVANRSSASSGTWWKKD